MIDSPAPGELLIEKEDRSPKKAKKDRSQAIVEEMGKISPLVSSTKAHVII